MLIDRKSAKREFDNSINSSEDWIYIIGKMGIGKSYFTKEITKSYKSIYCEPNHDFYYWRELFKRINCHSHEIVKILSKEHNINLPNNQNIGDLTEDKLEDILEDSISNEVETGKSSISKFLGKYLSTVYNYIVLDNLYKCDEKSYCWLIPLLDKFSKKEDCHIIAICDENTTWSFEKLREDLHNRFARIEVNEYDNADAYYELINTILHFDNNEILLELSKKLFKDFKGRSSEILKLLQLIKKDYKINSLSDNEKERSIIEKAAHLSITTIEDLSIVSKELLAVLALSPINLSAKDISKIILNYTEEDIINEIRKKPVNDLVENDDEGKYGLSNLFSAEIYISQLSKIKTDYINKLILDAGMRNDVYLDKKQLITLAIKCKSDSINKLAYSFFVNISETDKNLYSYSEILNEFLDAFTNIPSYLCDMKYVNILYRFGYYPNAYKIITLIKDSENNYNYLMKKGDIEHLILHKNTAKTFEQAANLSDISISQKLSAINRQIMALTQEGKQELDNARALYTSTIEKYKNEECNGLIELYRNSNNIFDYDTALTYTIKGYKLSVKLGNNLERIKSLHNICMLKLLSGKYYLNLNDPDLGFEPDFNMICHEFEKSDEFLHDLSYPLLDLGTLEMFKFVKNPEAEKNRLINAKSYFSRAQLYAKSFYAKNIAEVSLLVVNSYLHSNDSEYVQNARKRIYDKYEATSHDIKDFRVHRKILFALATSASITKDFDEGRSYLHLAKPHVFEAETLRYNNLCDDLKIPEEKISYVPKNQSHINDYHENSKFVPWLISFGH